MRSTHRRETARVIDRLLAAPQEFEFVQAVRILLGWLAEQGVPPAQALHTHLRFENSLRLGFPGAEVEGLSCTGALGAVPGPAVAADVAAGVATDVATDVAKEVAKDMAAFTLTPAFMGLLGGHGTLPFHVTERIAAWQQDHDDHAPRAFLDLLSGRMLALFYRAWHKHRIEQAQAGQADAFLPRLTALAGTPPGYGGSASAPLPDALFAHFAGMLQQRPVSAAVLERLLVSYFGERVRLEEAVGHWNVLAAGEQPALGVSAHLGENTLLGERSWRPDLRARLRIGPLGREAFARFLPGGSAAAALCAILQVVAEPTVGFEVQLILRGRDVAPSLLAGRDTAAVRLGRDSFLVGTDAGSDPAIPADRTDMRYLVMPMAPLPAKPAKKRRPRAA